jgi:sec-independent protein translocase protein TatA
MSRLLDNPLMVLVILLVIVLLFGAPRLPGMARSLGQSLRIFKSEVKDMREDSHPGDPDTIAAPTPRHGASRISSTSTDKRPADA